MIDHVVRVIGKQALDARKIFVLGVLLALAVVVVVLVSSRTVPSVQAADFVTAIESKLNASDAALGDFFRDICIRKRRHGGSRGLHRR